MDIFLVTEQKVDEIKQYLKAREIDKRWDIGIDSPEDSARRDYRDVKRECTSRYDLQVAEVSEGMLSAQLFK